MEGIKCQKLIYAKEFDDQGRCIKTKCLLGKIIEDSGGFITFRTTFLERRINKDYIISLEDTNIDFIEEAKLQ